MPAKMKKVRSKHKMPKNLEVIAVPKEEGKDVQTDLRNTLACDNAASVKWLKEHLFGGRILRVPVTAQRSKKKTDGKASPMTPFSVPHTDSGPNFDPTVKKSSSKKKRPARK